jgi:hypothetical protein
MANDQDANDTSALADRFLRTVVQQVLARGYLGAVEISASNVDQIAEGLVPLLAETNFDADIADYTEGLLDDALAATNDERNEVAILLYAIFFEHKINFIVHSFVKRKGLSEQVAIDLIRRMDIQQKLTSVLELLGFPPFGKADRDSIDRIMNRRNEFAHYKWKPRPDEYSGSLVPVISECQRIVGVLNDYEERYIFNGRREATKELIRSAWIPLLERLRQSMAIHKEKDGSPDSP